MSECLTGLDLADANIRQGVTLAGDKRLDTADFVAGIFTDQCSSSAVPSLADESFNVWVVEVACAAAKAELHEHEFRMINMI